MKSVSIIIPAYNEQDRLERTLKTLLQWKNEHEFDVELIVVDDGSSDRTKEIADKFADQTIQHRTNHGKGQALQSGWEHVSDEREIIVFLDADLEQSAKYVTELIQPVALDETDLTIAKLPPAQRKAGFGLVRKLAAWGIIRLTGFSAEEPLSGQRAMRRELLEKIGRLPNGFGIEVGLTIEAKRYGFRVKEVAVPFRHRETGRDLTGIVHRLKQLFAVGHTLWGLWRRHT